MGFNTGELNIISYEEDKFLKTHKNIYIDPPLKGRP